MSFVNRFIFPAPKPASYNKDSFPDELLFVPPKEKLYEYYKQFKMEQNNKDNGVGNHEFDLNSPKYPAHHNYDGDDSESKLNHRREQYCDENAIPCVYIERKYRLSEATHLLLYLHGNAEDLGKCYPIIDYIRMKLQVNILAPEYPGYGVSAGDACETSVQQMVQNVYEFAISPYGLNVPPSRIIIYGFSIGSAAALSHTRFSLKKVYLPDHYLQNDSHHSHEQKSNKKRKKRNKSKKKSSTQRANGNIGDSTEEEEDDEEEEEEEKKYEAAHHATSNKGDLLLTYNQQKSRKYFLSTFMDKCPHSAQEHEILFAEQASKLFYTSDLDSVEDGDPFERLPLASLLNILRKGNVAYPTSVNKKELLLVARKHGLIPPLNSCKKANIIRKYSLLIIVCPFASISQVVADKIGVFASYLLSERFKNVEAVKNVHGPLLIIHGKDDSIIPYQHSIELHKTAQKCDIQPTHLELLEGCDHNTMDLRKITNIINKFFKHQFNLCKSQKRVQQQPHNNRQQDFLSASYPNMPLNDGYDADDNLGHTPYANHSFVAEQNNKAGPPPLANGQPYPKTNHNNGRMIVELQIEIPPYCWLKPQQAAVELTEEDKARLRKKQEQDDEEYAFNLFMKQLMQHETMQHASASPLQHHQSRKLNKFFGDESRSVDSSQTQQTTSNSFLSAAVHENDAHLQDMETLNNNDVEPEYSLSQALRLQPHDIILPNDNEELSGSGD